MGNTGSHMGNTGSHMGNTGNHMGNTGNHMGNTGNSNRSPDASAETTAPSVVTGTDQYSQSAIVQDAGTSGEGQPPSTDNATEFACPICLGTSFRQDQIKRLRCSHVFHQSCIDMWLNNNGNCPLCRAPYRSIRPHRNRRHNRNRRPRGNRMPV
ncbi:hypothetical protein AVEN_47509-1 [Araneus ventricosus]|uniref:RING-type domain-containing protein n=1 Tax=Araneus ventricosus TaxID=182803 RepID=A0A4Y2FE87_ARAVE|nr:hypothetical protein AVEN_47509-1 [Araneus ventricosus]